MITEVILGSILILLLFLFKDSSIPKGMPPGVWGWPIFGQLPSTKIPFYQQVQMYKKKYGPIFTWKFGSRVYVYITDCKLIKEAFGNPLITNRPKEMGFAFFTNYNKAGLVYNHGQEWSDVRQFSLRYLKDNGMGKSSLEDYVTYEAECLVNDFRKYVDRPTDVPMSINAAVINVLWRIVAGKRYDLGSDEIQDFERLMTELAIFYETSKFFFFTFYPLISTFTPDYVKRNIIFKEPYKKLEKYQQFFMGVIEDHEKTFDADNIRDFVDAFLAEVKLNEEGKPSESTKTFTRMDLFCTLSDLFIAGSETASSTLRWTIYYMVKHQNVQLKAQNEIDNVVSRSKMPSLNDRKSLPYLDAILHEVMRFKTLLPLGLFHCAAEDTMIGKYQIPKGTTIVSNISGCHFDPDFWDNPNDFQPERFILPDGSFNRKNQNFIPFSAGRRVCPGESLARMELYLLAAALLQNFTFKSATGDDLSDPGSTRNFLAIPETMNIIISERK